MFEGLDRLPHYNEDHDTDDPHGEVHRLREQIAGADVVPDLDSRVQRKHARPSEERH